MTVFLFTMKRILNKKRAILTMFIVPVLISILVVQVNFNAPKIKIAVLNYDNTRFTDTFINNLDNSYRIENLDKEQIKEKLSSGEIDYGIIIDKGITKKIISGNMPDIRVVYDKKNGFYKGINENISSFMSRASEIALKSNDNTKIFYSKLDNFIQQNKLKTLPSESKNRMNILVSLNFLIMLMLYNAISMTNKIMKDKEEKLRTFAAPITIRSYTLQIVFTLFLLELVQVSVVFIALIIQYQLSIINYILKLFLLYSVFSFTAVSFAVVLNYINQIYIKKEVISSIVVVPVCMLGGCFWNIELAPRMLQFMAQFVPTNWIVKGNYEILEGKNYIYLGTDIGILVLFSIVFLLLGVFTKKDIVN